MEKAYDIFKGNFFEGSWMGNEMLNKAILKWGKRNKPDLYEEIDEPQGIYMEILIKDEGEPGDLADFINTLPTELKKDAIEGMCNDMESMNETKAKSFIGDFRMLLVGKLDSQLKSRIDEAVKSNPKMNAMLILAAKEGDLNQVKKAISGGADVNAKDKYGMTSLLSASYKSHLAVVRFLLEQNADINGKDKLGNDALYYAEGFASDDVIEILKNWKVK